jgi:uncharacterized membrane protein YbhN (UPF0104 family)
MSRRANFQLIISAAFLIVLVYLISKLNFEAAYREIASANKLFLSIGVLSLILAALVKVFRFALVSRVYHHPISILDASLIQMVGISIAIITPARVGEGSKAVLLNKRHGVPMTTSLGIVVFERLFDMLFLGLGAFTFSFYFLQPRITTLIGFFVVTLLAILVLFLKYINVLKKLVPEKYKAYFTEVNIKKSPGMLSLIFSATAFAWFLEAGLPWMLGRSMNISVPFPLVFGIVCISTIAVVLSILPAGIGTLDISFLLLFSLIGISHETAASILLIYRFFGLVVPFGLALIFLNYYGLSFKAVKHEIEQ